MYLNKLKNIAGPRLVISMVGGGSKGWDAGTRASKFALISRVQKLCPFKKVGFPCGKPSPIRETHLGNWLLVWETGSPIRETRFSF